MTRFPIFLSLVLVLRNQVELLPKILWDLTQSLSVWVDDYEVVIVDNASQDDSLIVLRSLLGEGGLPNVQVYALTKEVDRDIGAWVGLESALGDLVAFFDPSRDSLDFLPTMLAQAAQHDVVFAHNTHLANHSLLARSCLAFSSLFFRWFCGLNLDREAPQYRILSKKVVNFILRHPAPATAYRYLPATAGFSRRNLQYSYPTPNASRSGLFSGVERGIHLILSTSRGPMRLVSTLCFLGAGSNLIYSVYVIAIAFLKENVAPGWVTLSLQQSGMFFLISLVLLVLGEYVIQVVRLAYDGPQFHVAQEFTSIVMSRQQRLNVEEVHSGEVDARTWQQEHTLRHGL